MRRRICYRVLLLLVCLLAVLPGTAVALQTIPTVQITAQVQANGDVLITEQRTIADPRPVEFLELLAPGGVFTVIEMKDQKGAYQVETSGPSSDRHAQIVGQGKSVYIEWRDEKPSTPQELTISYRLTGGLILHEDAIEWYWPGLTGSGGRSVSRVDFTLRLPKAGEAYLYAYGGKAGGVLAGADNLQVRAVDVSADRPFEWRLLVPRAQLPEVTGSQGSSNLNLLRKIEADRIEREMDRAHRLWVAHWLLLASPFLIAALYWFTVRRFPAVPDPGALTSTDLTAVPPSVVGWVYDGDWFDYACAQLMYLERQKAVHWEWEHGCLHIVRVPLAAVGPADEKLFDLLHLGFEPISTEAIAERWKRTPGEFTFKRTAWLDAVGREVPPEWLSRPSLLWGAALGVIYLCMGVYSLAAFEWIAFWAVAAVLFVLTWKRRWLSPLGESHVARWVATYWSAIHPRKEKRWPRPDVEPEYFLAVEVGDQPLEKLMGNQRYQVVKGIYRDLT